jgi:hypothetical protein
MGLTEAIMRCAVATIVFLVAVVAPVCAYGEEASAADMSAVVPIAEGDRAPFTGMLFPAELAMQMGFRIENLQLRLRADVEREQQLCEAHMEFEGRRLELEQERRDFQVQQLTERVQEQAEDLAEAQNVPWYRTWGFAFGMGIVASIILVGGAVALMVALT